MSTKEKLAYLSDNVLVVFGVEDEVTGAAISDAVVEATVLDINEQPVVIEGFNWPVRLIPTQDVPGEYRGVVLPKSASGVQLNREYLVRYTVDAGPGRFATDQIRGVVGWP